MKKVIGGKVYDTSTAKELAVWNNDYAVNDFNHACETLHLKKTGEYFLHGKGGAMSKYAKVAYGSTNSWTSGEEIIPLSYEQARQWAEESLDGDEYIQIFGEPIEDGEVYINVKISSRAKAKLDQLRADGRTISEVIEGLLMDHEKR